MSISRQLDQVPHKKYLSYELFYSLCGSTTITSELISTTQAELSAGADPNTKGHRYYTFLSLVTKKLPTDLKESLIALLLFHKADPNIRHVEDQTTFLIRTHDSYYLHDTHDTRASALTIASDQKSWLTVMTLVTKTKIPHHQDLLGYALFCALSANDYIHIANETAKILLEAGANPNIRGTPRDDCPCCTFSYPLHLPGAYYNHDEDINITDLLLEKGADVTLTNASGETPLQMLLKMRRNRHYLSRFQESLAKIKNSHENRFGLIVFQRCLLRTQKEINRNKQEISRTLQLLLDIPHDIHLHIESFLLPKNLLRETKDPNLGLYAEQTQYEADTHRKKMAVFKKIYTALRDGQSGLFKFYYRWDKENLGSEALLNEIKRYKENNSESITAKAFALINDIDPSQPFSLELFLEIYQSSFESSLLFKKSKLLGEKNPFYKSSSLNIAIKKQQPISDQIFIHAKKFTFFGCRNRTFNILKALDMIDDKGNKKSDFARLRN